MAGAFLSDSWYRVAALRPRVREHARFSRQRVRGKAWYMVHDPLTNRVHRFSPTAWWVASQLDGGCTVDAAWQRALDELGDTAPSQDEVIQLLSQLHGADLLVSEAAPESDELLERRSRQDKPKWLSGLMNPMSVRMPLWDPDAFLAATLPALRPLLSVWGLAAWLLLVLPALFLAGQHWTELGGNLSDRLLSAGNLAGLLLVYPVVKLLHELGHGYAVKAGGGEVHEAGVMLLVFAPSPYVDASSSNAFRSRHYRAFVAAAGMMTELLLTALAMYVWLAVEPGVVHTIAFNVMTVAGISTLIFNGNPLLRYDGYYMLCDLAELPNLGQRANSYWSWLLRRYPFGDHEAAEPDASPTERRWLLFYAPAAFLYRATVALSIALFIANEYFFLGVLLALWSVAGLVLVPAFKSLRFLIASPALERSRTRALAVSGGAAALVLLFGAFVPLPHSSTAEGVVWVPQGAEVRAQASGFVLDAPVRPMSAVQPGQLLLVQQDRALAARHHEQLARVAEQEAQALLDLATDRARAFQTRLALERERAALADIEERVAQLSTLSGAAGVFLRPRGEDAPGSYVKRGDLVGHIVAPGQRVVRAVVEQADVALVRGELRQVEVMLSDRIGEVLTGRVARAVPQADEGLPSKALAVEGGGTLVLDPRNPDALRTLEKVFQFDVDLDGAPADLRIGTRAHLRFRYAPEPLFSQAFRRVRQLFLARLHV